MGPLTFITGLQVVGPLQTVTPNARLRLGRDLPGARPSARGLAPQRSVRRLSGPPFDSRPAPRRLAAAPQSAPADQGASRLPTSGVSAGTPSANSPAKERFTNSGAPTM